MRSFVIQKAVTKQSNKILSTCPKWGLVSQEQPHEANSRHNTLLQKRTISNSSGVEPAITNTLSHELGKMHIYISPPQSVQIQPKLKINTPGDRYEQEADAMAEKVMRAAVQPSPKLNIGCLMNGTIQRKCSECEAGEEKEGPILMRKAYNAGGYEASSTITAQLNTTKGSGIPLPKETQYSMEQAFGVNFSNIRIHTNDQAARLSQQIQARAFTHGQDIYFNQGAFNPASNEGKKLLAHELTHTVQQSNNSPFNRAPAAQLYRTPEPEQAEDSAEEKQVCVSFIVTTDANAGSSSGYCETLKEDMLIDLDPHQVYAGDVFLIKVQELDNPPASWQLPAELEQVQKVNDNSIQVRVKGRLLPNEADRNIKFSIVPGEGLPNIPVMLKLANLAPQANAVNPDLVQNQTEMINLRKERTLKKQEFRSEKREARQEFRALDRSDKRKKRSEFRKGKAKLRSQRRDERRRLRKQHQELKKERRTLEQQNGCGLDNEKMITRALNRAILVASKAVSRLQKGTADKTVASTLSTIMKWLPDPGNPAAGQLLIQKVTDVLLVARNNMLLSDSSKFQCGSIKCDADTGAFVPHGGGRSDLVTVCSKWVKQEVNFGITGDAADQQAFALLHEFVHLAGPQGANETYVHKTSEWKALTHQKAMQMADGYARVAWQLAQ